MGKFAIINTAGLAVLILLGLGGYLNEVVHSSVFVAVLALLGMVLTGLVMIVLKKIDWAKWICSRLTGFGLAGTVLGVINTFTHASFVGDATAVMQSMAAGLGLALFSTLTGVLGWLWLDFNIAHQGDFDA